MKVTSLLALSDTELITTVKSFIVLVQVLRLTSCTVRKGKNIEITLLNK
jgi:hypothetical protein